MFSALAFKWFWHEILISLQKALYVCCWGDAKFGNLDFFVSGCYTNRANAMKDGVSLPWCLVSWVRCKRKVALDIWELAIALCWAVVLWPPTSDKTPSVMLMGRDKNKVHPTVICEWMQTNYSHPPNRSDWCSLSGFQISALVFFSPPLGEITWVYNHRIP